MEDNQDNHLVELLNRVGKCTFINHYYDFKDLYLNSISANQVKDKLSSINDWALYLRHPVIL